MNTITLRAHFDGERILLDEPFELPANTPLMVTVLTQEIENERRVWNPAAVAALARAYADDEPEYGLVDVKHD